ncbi:MAG: small subunit ribosomal protein [Thermoplasmata archaeon]|jgi:small subunit ribosomal protein S3|nr:small subunit ribosomal protein [Thermoplasmata archaeon]
MAVERKFIKESVNRLLVKDFVKKETERAGYGGMEIQRTPLGTRVNIVAERPGMVIGRRGATINELTSKLHSKYGIENPQISVEEPNYNPGLNAQIMAIKVAESLERGWHFRRVGHSTVQRVMASGAQGVIVEIAGKLTGQRKRREKFIAGHVKYCGETALTLMDVGYAQCKKKLGVIGCTVRIMKKDAVLPDTVKLFAPGEKDALQAAAKARAAQAAAGVQTVAPDMAGAQAGQATPAQPAGAPPAAAPTGPREPAPSTGPAAVPGRRERKSFTVGGNQ